MQKRTMITISGVTKSLKQWSTEYNIGIDAIKYRIINGFSENSILLPSAKRKSKEEKVSDIMNDIFGGREV